MAALAISAVLAAVLVGSGQTARIPRSSLKSHEPSAGKVALALAQVSSPAASPSSCADMNLEEVKDAAAAMDSANGFECFKNYFAVLGGAQTEEELTSSLINTAGAYSGHMDWFDGNSFTKGVVNAMWDGVDFDGHGKAEITTNVPGFISGPPDIGTATYQATCPELDSHPCVKIDFTAGSLPRFYYTRKVSSTTFLTFVHTQDGSGKYSDINVLELK